MEELRAEEALSTFGIYSSFTRGTSMWPLFKTHRDRVYLARVTDTLRPLDVAMYPDAHGNYIMHRVVRVCEDHYLIRGDNTFVLERVPHECVIGVLIEFDRNGKHSTVSSPAYRLYSRVWNLLYPVRYLFHGLLTLLRRIRRKFRTKKSDRP